MKPRVSTLQNRVRRLRREQTEAERRLWVRLRDRQLDSAKFRRQHLVGSFIADFCCSEHRLVVELDGGQHVVQEDADQARTAFLNQRGYRVLRFWNHEVMQDLEAVLQQIVAVLQDPHPNPLPSREREKRRSALAREKEKISPRPCGERAG